MGEIRYKEMLKVKQTLRLTRMGVFDPREIENIVREHILKIEPGIIVTYPVHGISCFHDHLVTHAVVKRVFLELRDSCIYYSRRLVFKTIENKGFYPRAGDRFILKQSPPE